jgi:hypothetical protein
MSQSRPSCGLRGSKISGLHRALGNDAAHNASERLTANVGDTEGCAGAWIRARVESRGRYTLTHSRQRLLEDIHGPVGTPEIIAAPSICDGRAGTSTHRDYIGSIASIRRPPARWCPERGPVSFGPSRRADAFPR